MPDFDVHFKSEPWPEHLPNPFANEIPKPKAFLMEATEHKKTPTNEGKRRHPPDGFYFNTGSACTCKPVCPKPCKGGCGCRACLDAYSDFLSVE